VRGADFRSLYSDGKKITSERFVLFLRENQQGYHRLGITVSRKVGGAVIRNRVKRLFREIFRRFSADIPSHFDLVLNAKRSCAEASYEELREEFLSVTRKIRR
jgi:ribonuclease P protein component